MDLTCENCGNQYEKSFKIVVNQKEHVFDSFECAINKMAPRCDQCGSMIIGHGLEDAERRKIFCCGHCARSAGIPGFVDKQ